MKFSNCDVKRLDPSCNRYSSRTSQRKIIPLGAGPLLLTMCTAAVPVTSSAMGLAGLDDGVTVPLADIVVTLGQVVLLRGNGWPALASGGALAPRSGTTNA